MSLWTKNFGIASRNIQVSYIGSNGTTFGTSNYSFAAEPIGTPSQDRLVVVVITAGGSGGVLNSATIGGISATIAVQDVSGSGLPCAIIYAVVPTGTTADIDFTFNSNRTRCGIDVYTLTNYVSSTPYLTDSNNQSGSTDPSVTDSIPANSVVIAGAIVGASTTCTWTGVTEDSDRVIESSSTHTAAHLKYTTPSASQLIKADFASGSARVLVVAVWK